jgi:release factor glutamine methyltransferase
MVEPASPLSPPCPRHEPHLALDGGEGLALDSLLPICRGAAAWLQPGGFLALETAGGEQAHYVADLLANMRCGAVSGLSPSGASSSGGKLGDSGLGGEAGEDEPAFVDVRVRKDLRGVDRFVTASRAGGAA